ncbi:MAG: hypothetical protein ACI9HB_003410 [Gammaproteobacteria bacterium]|jgi:hypothetical protein
MNGLGWGLENLPPNRLRRAKALQSQMVRIGLVT